MPKQGDAWIESAQKRRLETAVISPLLPAAGAVAVTNRFRQTMHEVPRSLYPGDTFITRKLGDPDQDTPLLRWFRRAMVDELPQVLEVWEGSMTLIGPRADEPEHIEQLFAALEDTDLRDRWQEVRFRQRPGIVSSYAVHSHRHNLEGVSEGARFSEEEARAINARQRATMDIADFEAASFGHDLRLLGGTAAMAAANYGHYARNLLLGQPQPTGE